MALSVKVDDAADNQANTQPRGTMMDISTTADRAADILEIQGHIKNDWGSDGNPRCIGGAMSQACKELVSPDYTFGRIAETVESMVGRNLVSWNNAPERKPEEVIQVLRDVATKHRGDAMTVEAGK